MIFSGRKNEIWQNFGHIITKSYVWRLGICNKILGYSPAIGVFFPSNSACFGQKRLFWHIFSSYIKFFIAKPNMSQLFFVIWSFLDIWLLPKQFGNSLEVQNGQNGPKKASFHNLSPFAASQIYLYSYSSSYISRIKSRLAAC